MKRSPALPLALVSVLTVLGVLVPAAANASAADDDAELSQTIWVAWLMPGPFSGKATWPQTYLPDGVPECGDGAVQVDLYRYGTDEVRAYVDALVAGGVLTSFTEDARVLVGNEYYYVELEPCTPIDETPVDPDETPVDPGETPVDPAETPVDPGTPPTVTVLESAVTPTLPVLASSVTPTVTVLESSVTQPGVAPAATPATVVPQYTG